MLLSLHRGKITFKKRLATAGKQKCRKKVFATMATRFEKVDDESIEEFLTELNKKETQRRAQSIREMFLKKWTTERNVNTNLE